MPDKIMSMGKHPAEGQSLFDLMFPKQMRMQAGLTDAEASFLYNSWKNSPVGSFAIPVPQEAEKMQVNALKTKGYITGFGNGMELTDKGKKIIVEMVTHEPNSFEKRAKELSYSGIKAKSANARPRQALLNKRASKEKGSFNLRRESIKRMSE